MTPDTSKNESGYEILLQKENNVSERFPIPATGLEIGRSSDCAITLADQLVSRRHAKIEIVNEGLHVTDLKSSNGIQINGVHMEEGLLREGDSLRVGHALFRVSKTAESSLGRSIITPERVEELYESMVNGPSDSRLPILYRAAQLLGDVFDLDELLNQILALIFEALPVRRGFVLTMDNDSVEPRVRATLSREEGDQGPPLSHTLIQHVFDSKDAMLTMDAQEDSRFDQAASIMGHEIHAAMCAPLCGRASVVGAIYVDSGTASGRFSKKDLELLAAIARVVGVAVENARLYQENVAHERLIAIGEATAGLGHCIKNILTGIRGGAEFITMSLESKELKYLERGWPILRSSIDRIDNLVLNMLSFSKDRAPERQQSDMNSLVRDTLDMVRPRADKYKVELDFQPDMHGHAEIDAREIYRVIMNLVLNSIEACQDKGGKVTVSVMSEQDGCTLKVTDNGCGIPPEILPKLSQAFVSSKGSSGTGLGLACSYKIVREHGGRIDVESEVGKGTTFTVFLPCEIRAGVPTQRIEVRE